ncbi:MAG: tetratricopeptide repeat protein [Acidobacteriota bacterium]
MKTAVFIGIFSLVVLTPYRCGLAQAAKNTPTINRAANNQSSSSTLEESIEAIPNEPSRVASPAQMSYDAGVTLYNSGKLDQAISAFKKANKLKPDDPQTQYMLGMVYWRAKAFDDCANFFKRAIRLKPDWAEAHFRLGLAYYVLGRKTQSQEEYERLLELNSPLAQKLQLVYSDTSPTNVVKNLESPSAAPTAKNEVVPIPSSAAIAPSDKNKRLTASESKNGPATVVTPRTETTIVPAIRIATGDPSSNKKNITPDDMAPTEIYKVGVGDVLDISLLNSNTNRSTLYSVVEGGLIELPIASGPLSVAGLTTKEIQAKITIELKRLGFEDRGQVAVVVRQYASHTVTITGLVSNPGTKTLRREAVPLFVLLAEAQPKSDAARAVIMRPESPTQVIDLSDSIALNALVHPGDVIKLTSRPQDFYFIGGRINNPGQKTYQPGITLVQAILAAGGSAQDHVAEVSRENPDGRLASTKFNLKEIKSGKIRDPKLLPGDRVEILH